MRTPLHLLALAILSLLGCTTWDAKQWDVSHLRDPRAAEMDERLSRSGPSVPNPFGAQRQIDATSDR